jgi:hypothetical protein
MKGQRIGLSYGKWREALECKNMKGLLGLASGALHRMLSLLILTELSWEINLGSVIK